MCGCIPSQEGKKGVLPATEAIFLGEILHLVTDLK